MRYCWPSGKPAGHDIWPRSRALVQGFGIAETVFKPDGPFYARGGITIRYAPLSESARILRAGWMASMTNPADDDSRWKVTSAARGETLLFPDICGLHTRIEYFVAKQLEISSATVDGQYDASLDLRCPPMTEVEPSKRPYFKECRCNNWLGARHFYIIEYDAEDDTFQQFGPFFSKYAIIDTLLETALIRGVSRKRIRFVEGLSAELPLPYAPTRHDNWTGTVMAHRKNVGMPAFFL